MSEDDAWKAVVNRRDAPEPKTPPSPLKIGFCFTVLGAIAYVSGKWLEGETKTRKGRVR